MPCDATLELCAALGPAVPGHRGVGGVQSKAVSGEGAGHDGSAERAGGVSLEKRSFRGPAALHGSLTGAGSGSAHRLQ